MGLSQSILRTHGLFGRKKYYSNSAISITPTLDAELLVNAAFAAWPGDNPDGWTVLGETGATQEVTERDPTQGHADTKTVGGAANFYHESAVNNPQLLQAVLTVHSFFKIEWALTRRVAGSIRVGDSINGMSLGERSAVAAYAYTGRATNASFAVTLANSAATANVTVDTFSVKLLSNMEQLFAHAQPYGDFSVALTIPNALYQAGITFNCTDANNWEPVYYDRLHSRLYVLKRVAGTPSVVNSYPAVYAAGATLTARRHIDGTLDVIYYGVTLATGLTSTGLTGLQAGPFATDASGVVIGSYTWDARAAT